MARIISITASVLMMICVVSSPAFASFHNLSPKPQEAIFIFPDLVYRQTVEYVYTLESIEEQGQTTPLISAIITSFDRDGNITAIELKDRHTLTSTEKILEDLARDIVMGNMEKEIVSIRYELNMIGDPVSADIMYFDLGELMK